VKGCAKHYVIDYNLSTLLEREKLVSPSYRDLR